MRPGYARCGLIALLISAALLVAHPAVATAQNNNSVNINAQYQSQNCEVIVNQYNQAIAGDATAVTGEAAEDAVNEAIAETAAAVNAPINVVQNCVQAGRDAGLVASDSDDNGNVVADETTGDGSNLNFQLQEQNCSVIIRQYNQAIAGDAIASGEAAIAATAAAVNAPISVVQKCVQAGGDVQTGGAGKEETTLGTDSKDDRKTAADDKSGVIAATIPNKTLANTGGMTGLIAGV